MTFGPISLIEYADPLVRNGNMALECTHETNRAPTPISTPKFQNPIDFVGPWVLCKLLNPHPYPATGLTHPKICPEPKLIVA